MEQTPDIRDRVFHDVVGEDGHDYVRTYGSGVVWSDVYGQASTSSQVSVDLERKRMRQELREELREEFRDEINDMRQQLDLIRSRQEEGGCSGVGQVPDASSTHRSLREPHEDGRTPSTQLQHELPTPSPYPRSFEETQVVRAEKRKHALGLNNTEVHTKVDQLSSHLPRQVVVKGILLSVDPSKEVESTIGT